MRRYELTDSEWERIKKYFPDKVPGTPGRPPNPHRPIINGIVWIARSGALMIFHYVKNAPFGRADFFRSLMAQLARALWFVGNGIYPLP